MKRVEEGVSQNHRTSRNTLVPLLGLIVSLGVRGRPHLAERHRGRDVRRGR